jgi:hypothetical protein
VRTGGRPARCRHRRVLNPPLYPSGAAPAAKTARIFYRMSKYRQAYHPLSLDHYETKYRARTLASLRKRGASLGFELVHSPAMSDGVS